MECVLTHGLREAARARSRGPDLPLMDPIEPNEHAIDNQQLLANLGSDVVIDGGLVVNADRRQLFGYAVRAHT